MPSQMCMNCPMWRWVYGKTTSGVGSSPPPTNLRCWCPVSGDWREPIDAVNHCTGRLLAMREDIEEALKLHTKWAREA